MRITETSHEVRMAMPRNNYSETQSRVLRSLPGDVCELAVDNGCDGKLFVYSSHNVDGWRVRYLECSACGHKPDDSKWAVPEPLKLDQGD